MSRCRKLGGVTRDRRFESGFLQRRVNKLSVPLTTPVVRSHDPFAVERPVGRKGSDRQSAASDVRRSGRSRRTGFGLLPPWPQPVGTSSTCCAIARSANSASSPCTCRSERRRRVRAGQALARAVVDRYGCSSPPPDYESFRGRVRELGRGGSAVRAEASFNCEKSGPWQRPFWLSKYPRMAAGLF